MLCHRLCHRLCHSSLETRVPRVRSSHTTPFAPGRMMQVLCPCRSQLTTLSASTRLTGRGRVATRAAKRARPLALRGVGPSKLTRATGIWPYAAIITDAAARCFPRGVRRHLLPMEDTGEGVPRFTGAGKKTLYGWRVLPPPAPTLEASAAAESAPCGVRARRRPTTIDRPR